MSTSNDNVRGIARLFSGEGREEYRPFRVLLAYLGASLFLLVFGSIYTYFGHGKSSPFMSFAFLVPLVMGTLPFLLFKIAGRRSWPDRFSRSVYRWSCATLSVGSVIEGVIVIYGTDSRYSRVYLWAGIAFFAVAVSVYAANVFACVRARRR